MPSRTSRHGKPSQGYEAMRLITECEHPAHAAKAHYTPTVRERTVWVSKQKDFIVHEHTAWTRHTPPRWVDDKNHCARTHCFERHCLAEEADFTFTALEDTIKLQKKTTKLANRGITV